MSRDELLSSLRGLELKLRGPDMIQFAKQQDAATRTKFSEDLADLSANIGTIENAELAEISARLDALAPDLKAGIQNLGDEIDKIDKTIAIFNTIGTVVNLAARVAGLVV